MNVVQAVVCEVLFVVCVVTTTGCGAPGGMPDEEDSSELPAKGAGCVHDVCTIGTKLRNHCSLCVSQVCASDLTCCKSGWDADCVSLAESLCAATCDGPSDPPSTGAFTGSYFDNKDFTALQFTRTDAAIDFDWGSGAPDASMGSDAFSVRWEGDFDFDGASYAFTTVTDDGVRLYIDDTLVLDQWVPQASATHVVTRTMTAGVHRIRMDYYEEGGGAVARLSWAKSSTPPASQIRELQLYIAMDGEFSQQIAPADPKAYVEKLIAESNVWWERDLNVRIKAVLIEPFPNAATDPFVTSNYDDVLGLLTEWRDYGNGLALERDANHLLTGRPMMFGGYTYVGVTCSHPSFSYGWSQVGVWGYTFTQGAFNVELAHQLGAGYPSDASCVGSIMGTGAKPADYHDSWFCDVTRNEVDAHLAASPLCLQLVPK